MYKTVAIGPVVITQHLWVLFVRSLSVPCSHTDNSSSRRIKSSSFLLSAKFILITTEGGSIALRTREEGGGQFGHHGSKAAANMVGKLLAFDLEKIGVTAVMIHVSASLDNSVSAFVYLLVIYHSLGLCGQT